MTVIHGTLLLSFRPPSRNPWSPETTRAGWFPDQVRDDIMLLGLSRFRAMELRELMLSSSTELSFIPNDSPKLQRRVLWITIVAVILIIAGGLIFRFIQQQKHAAYLVAINVEEELKAAAAAYHNLDCSTALPHWERVLASGKMAPAAENGIRLSKGYCEGALGRSQEALLTLEAALAQNPTAANAAEWIRRLKDGQMLELSKQEPLSPSPNIAAQEARATIQKLLNGSLDATFPKVDQIPDAASNTVPANLAALVVPEAIYANMLRLIYVGGQEGYEIRYALAISPRIAADKILQSLGKEWVNDTVRQESEVLFWSAKMQNLQAWFFVYPGTSQATEVRIRTMQM